MSCVWFDGGYNRPSQAPSLDLPDLFTGQPERRLPRPPGFYPTYLCSSASVNPPDPNTNTADQISFPNTAGTPTPGSATSRETRYAARPLRALRATPSTSIPSWGISRSPPHRHCLIGKRALHTTRENSSEKHPRRGQPSRRACRGPRHRAVAHHVAMANRQLLPRQLEESSAILCSLTPSVPANNSAHHATTAAPMSITVQSAAPMNQTVQPAAPMKATVQENSLFQPVPGTLVCTPAATHTNSGSVHALRDPTPAGHVMPIHRLRRSFSVPRCTT